MCRYVWHHRGNNNTDEPRKIKKIRNAQKKMTENAKKSTGTSIKKKEYTVISSNINGGELRLKKNRENRFKKLNGKRIKRCCLADDGITKKNTMTKKN